VNSRAFVSLRSVGHQNAGTPTLTAVFHILASAPNWAERLTAWSTLALAIGVGAAFIGTLLARKSIKETVNSRHAQIALEMTGRWDGDIRSIKQSVASISSEQLAKRVAKGERRNSNDFYDLERFANYFEQLGTLYKLGVLELSWIDELLGSSVMEYWDLWSPSVLVDRPRHPKLYENWELIAGQIHQRRAIQAITQGGDGRPRVSIFILRHLLHRVERRKTIR
jgi:hypothetical protein